MRWFVTVNKIDLSNKETVASDIALDMYVFYAWQCTSWMGRLFHKCGVSEPTANHWVHKANV